MITHRLTDSERKVLEILIEDGGESWRGYKALEEETGIPRAELGSILRSLRLLRLATWSPCCDEDGRPHGSGWFWTCMVPATDEPSRIPLEVLDR